MKMLDIYTPDEGGFSTFIYFHGGGLERGSRLGSGVGIIAKYLCDRGIAVVSAEYRLYPEAKYPDFICDAADATGWVIDNIASFGGNGKIYLGGSSAGGYLSMMLCFDSSYLEARGVNPDSICGYVHNAGQPTTHFNVLRERGIDTRSCIIDSAAPLYYVGRKKSYPPMVFIVSDNDMKCRLEQTRLMVATMSHFECDTGGVELRLMHGRHCGHCYAIDENGESVFGRMIYDLISK